jgi:hypothetical protein
MEPEARGSRRRHLLNRSPCRLASWCSLFSRTFPLIHCPSRSAVEILAVTCCCTPAREAGQDISCSSGPSADQLRDSSGRAQGMISILLGEAHSKLSRTGGLLLPFVPHASVYTSLVKLRRRCALAGAVHGTSETLNAALAISSILRARALNDGCVFRAGEQGMHKRWHGQRRLQPFADTFPASGIR